METNKIKIDGDSVKTGAKVIGRTLCGVGRVVAAVFVMTIEILHDVIKDKGKVE